MSVDHAYVITNLTIAREVQSAAGFQARYEFSVSEEKGALLYLSHSAKKYSVRNGRKIIEYLKQHHSEWYHYARNHVGLRIQSSDLVLVHGYVKTKEWTVAAVRSGSTAQAGKLEAQAGFQAVGNISFEWNRSSSTSASLQSRKGPKRRIDQSRSPSPSPSTFSGNRSLKTVSRTSTNSLGVPHIVIPDHEEGQHDKVDQCIFLRYYKVKWRIGPFVLRAGAGPHQLPPGGREGDAGIEVDSDSDVETNPPLASASYVLTHISVVLTADQVYSTVDMVLDYILQVRACCIMLRSN